MQPNQVTGPREPNQSTQWTHQPSARQHPLAFEYSRIQKELELNDRLHKEEVLKLTIAYQEEIEEIKKMRNRWLAEEEQKMMHEIDRIQSNKSMVIHHRELAHLWRQHSHYPQALEQLILAGSESHPIDLSSASPPPLVCIPPVAAPSTYLGVLLDTASETPGNPTDFYQATSMMQNECFQPVGEMDMMRQGFARNQSFQD